MVHQPMGNSEAVGLIDYWRMVVKRKHIIVLFVAVVTIITVVYSLLVTKRYEAQAVIMPISSNSGKMPAMFDRMSGFASLAGYNIGNLTALTQFMVLLNSDTLAEEIVKKYDLMNVLLKKKSTNSDELGAGDDRAAMEDAVDNIKRIVKFFDNRKMETITISAMMEDPQLAANIVNGYLDALRRTIKENAFTVAKRNRMFIEEQVTKNKNEYFASWKELNEYYKTGRISSAGMGTNISPSQAPEMNALADSEIASLDQDMQSDAVQSELNSVAVQKESVEKQIREAESLKNVSPQVYVQYLTLRNSLLGRTGALLAQQYEMAKIEEARNDLSFQVVDTARVPTKRCYPKRTSMVVQAFLVSLILSLIAVIFLEYVHKVRSQVPHAN